MTEKEAIEHSSEPFNLDGLLQGLGAAILKSIRDPFGIIARDYRILWLNKAMAIIHGGRQEYACGKICYEFFYEASQPCKDCPLDTVFKTGRSNISEQYQDFPDGTRRWGEVKAYPVRGSDRSVEAAYVIVFDITDLKRTIESQKKYSRYLSGQLGVRSGESQTVFLDDGDIAIQTSLTLREKEVLRLITEGHTNTQVAETLVISPHTVKSHVIHIFNKLGVSDRTQAAVMAIRYKLI